MTTELQKLVIYRSEVQVFNLFYGDTHFIVNVVYLKTTILYLDDDIDIQWNTTGATKVFYK